MRLRDKAPHEFSEVPYTEMPSFKHADVEVVREVDGRNERWPGKQRNVMVWWELANGKAVGWNENPSIGWSFPLITVKKI